MLRIIAGELGGRRLRAPAGLATRPTTDRVREALFNILVSSPLPLYGGTVLDLYAGSGALGGPPVPTLAPTSSSMPRGPVGPSWASSG